MIPLDPKKAQKVGEEWGKVTADSVFGVVDVVSKHNAKKEAYKSVIAHNNKVSQQNKILKDMAIKEMEREQEKDMLARMSPSQRDAYRKAQAAEKRREHDEAEARAERNTIIQLFLAFFIGLPLIVYIFLFILVAIFSGTDRSSYRSLSPFVPGSQAIFGKY